MEIGFLLEEEWLDCILARMNATCTNLEGGFKELSVLPKSRGWGLLIVAHQNSSTTVSRLVNEYHLGTSSLQHAVGIQVYLMYWVSSVCSRAYVKSM